MTDPFTRHGLPPTAVPWTVTDPMLERARLVALHADGLYSVADLAARAGVIRETAYKWIARYREGGLDALADRSHVARGHPATTPPEVEALETPKLRRARNAGAWGRPAAVGSAAWPPGYASKATT